MNEVELAEFVTKYVQPNVLDVEIARRKVLARLSEEQAWAIVTSAELVEKISKEMAPDPFPTPDGYISLTPDLNVVKAKIAVREALQSLHAEGAIVAIGVPGSLPGPEQATFSYHHARGMGGLPNTSVYYPVVNHAYRLASMFQGDKYRLASGDAYLSHLERFALTSRAARCLAECVNAFRHGLYLSAAMNAGAASENLWMELGRLTYAKTGNTKALDAELKRPYPSIGVVIDQTWQALTSHADAEFVLRSFLRDTEIGVDSVDGALAHVAVAQVGPLGVVVGQPAVEIGL